MTSEVDVIIATASARLWCLGTPKLTGHRNVIYYNFMVFMSTGNYEHRDSLVWQFAGTTATLNNL